MNIVQLESVARALVAPGKGILAADESSATANKRFAAVYVTQDEDHRRTFREILLTTPDAVGIVSGVIFYDETFWEKGSSGELFREYCAKHGIIPGIKVDEGLTDLPGFPGEKVSKGLDTLPERIQKYAEAGAQFAKWRSVIVIGEKIPTDACIAANAYVLARYARICQEAGVVPIVEPEVLFDGKHTSEQCEAVTSHVLETLFAAMRTYRVHFPGAILKTGMVLPGKDSGIPVDETDVADRTVRTLRTHVPHDIGGVVFLSGGQTPHQAFANLNAIAQRGPHPWGLTFSYSRALQDPVLKHWAVHQTDIVGAQSIFAHQLKVAQAARSGSMSVAAHSDDFVSHSQDM
ncbi:MAG TPA: class I fructose-bisphosphate aldolase [Candidatus Paceibacterota bacterium]|nr:class I fructose-bisphosphate aldolase [Candidatus Paceibacterota bacterium]